ncbi:hypothetical protein AX16_010904 [Volvariella volvacea WC 439]|nr:hypothetical protein AX16_010904 [Volvariella volvacea WC 439]
MSGRYIVVFKDSATEAQIQEYVNRVNNSGGAVSHTYDVPGLKGFAATIPDSFLENLQSDSVIDYVEPDQIVTTQ